MKYLFGVMLSGFVFSLNALVEPLGKYDQLMSLLERYRSHDEFGPMDWRLTLPTIEGVTIRPTFGPEKKDTHLLLIFSNDDKLPKSDLKTLMLGLARSHEKATKVSLIQRILSCCCPKPSESDNLKSYQSEEDNISPLIYCHRFEKIP